MFMEYCDDRGHGALCCQVLGSVAMTVAMEHCDDIGHGELS